MAASPSARRIDPKTVMGAVQLRVASLARSLEYYVDLLGFRMLDRSPSRVVLGAADGLALLELHEVPSASPAPESSAGLFHFAVRIANRAELGKLVRHLSERSVSMGAEDHGTTEAVYLSDPDRNGVEFYCDQPKDRWIWTDGLVHMPSDPLHLSELIAAAGADAAGWCGVPAGTVMGHMHLKVSEIASSEAFYHGILGFDVTSYLPGAVFMSAGGYHHHLAVNTWKSEGALPAPENTAGLAAFTIVLPDRAALAQVVDRLAENGIPASSLGDGIETTDPSGLKVRLVSRGEAGAG